MRSILPTGFLALSLSLAGCGSPHQNEVVLRFPVPKECASFINERLNNLNKRNEYSVHYFETNVGNASEGYPSLAGFMEVRSSRRTTSELEAIVNNPIFECYPISGTKMDLDVADKLLIYEIKKYKSLGAKQIYLAVDGDSIQIRVPNRFTNEYLEDIRSEPPNAK